MVVKILGRGVWGNALHSVVSQNSSSVTFLGREESSSDQDVLVLALPVQAIRCALGFVSFGNRKKIIINTAKGIEKETHLLPEQIVKEVMGEDLAYYSLIGPSFAQEVVDKMPTLVNIAYNEPQDLAMRKQIGQLFQTSYFAVRFTKDILALELSSAFKNIYAIACGISMGLGFGTNTRVEMIILAMEELQRLFAKMHLAVDPASIAGTTGDLILTCTSIESRNFLFGKYLAELSVEKSLKKVQSCVEGFHSLDSVSYFEKKYDLSLPLASFVKSIVELNNPEIVREQFLQFVKKSAVRQIG